MEGILLSRIRSGLGLLPGGMEDLLVNKNLVAGVVAQIAGKVGLEVRDVEEMLEKPPRREMGDLAIPCFKLAGKLKRPPVQIALDIVSAVTVEGGVDRLEAAGGYVNMFLKKEMVSGAVLERVLAEGWSKRDAVMGPGPVIVEYSSPNIAKPFGVGHLRSTVIGNSLARLYEHAGYKVVRLNYLGDWGTQFGMLLALWTREGRGRPEEAGADDVVEVYVRANRADAEDPEFSRSARDWFKRLECGDREATELWQAFREKSLRSFREVYGILGTDEFDSYDGEAAIARRPETMADAVGRVEAKGLAVKSEGALIVDLAEYDMPPLILRKSDGTSTYHTRDLAALLQRWERYGFHKMLYVVGQDQRLHFRQLFKTIELMGMEWVDRCAHVDFGMIRFGGSKMSTRGGNVVFLDSVLKDVMSSVRGIVRENNPDLDATTVDEVSTSVGTGAIIFADLSRRRIKDFEFDREQASSLTGDTGPYLQYSHARLAGILRKAADAGVNWESYDPGELTAVAESALLDKLGEYENAVVRSAEAMEPSILAGYLIDLAGGFNSFYAECRVLGVGETVEKARLALVEATRRTMAQGLYLLGIAAPERM